MCENAGETVFSAGKRAFPDAEVAGSNPVAPTILKSRRIFDLALLSQSTASIEPAGKQSSHSMARISTLALTERASGCSNGALFYGQFSMQSAS